MGLLRSLFTGQPDPVLDQAMTGGSSQSSLVGFEDRAPASETFAAEVPAGFYGLTSYQTPIAPEPRVSRREAIQVPAVKRSRDLIAGTLGSLPLGLIAPDLSRSRSALFEQPEADVPRTVTMARTVEDLLFEGVAWWRIVEFGWHNYPVRVRRLDPRTVNVREDMKVYVSKNGEHTGTAEEWVPDDQLIRFDSPNDGLLTAGARAIRTCIRLDAAAARNADGVPPVDYFSPADDVDPAEDEEIQAILDAWQEARRKRATGYVPASLKYNSGGFNAKDLQMAEQRQHAVLEIARLCGIDPEELGVSTTSRTYANQFDRRKNFVDFTLGDYRAAIEGRLSMGDVTPRGYTARFDLDDFLRSDTKTRYETYEVGLRVGAIDKAEIRRAEGKPPLGPAPTPQEQTVDADDQSTILRAVQNFADDDVVTFDAPSAPEVFSVDRERRTIRGLAVPYGTVSNDGRTFAFSKGSITFSDPKRIKLLIAHDWGQAVGHATSLEDTDAGLVASFKVARGPEGDRALSMAEDGVWDGLSVGIGKGMKTRVENGVMHVLSAPLREISQTPCPAYDGARITEVAASADQKGNTMECTKCGQVHADGVVECQTEPTFSAGSTDFSALSDALSAGIKQGFEDLSFPQRETVSAGRPVVEVTEPSPYRFDGNPGEHCFVEDMRDAQQGDAEARQRLEKFGDEFAEVMFAVTTGNTGTLNPTQNRPDLYVPQLTYTRPLWDAVSTGSITDKTPFTVPKFASASGLVGDHTEGVEPTPGAFTATSQTVTPSAVSGKIEINREVLDQGGSPQADAIIWGEMVNAYYEAIEVKIANLLASVGTAELNLGGATDEALQDALTGYFAGLQFVRGGNRFTGLVLDGQLFPALVAAKDSTGRALFPVLGPTNAQGSTGGAFDRIQIGNQTGRAAWALGSAVDSQSYSFVPSSVWAWASAPRRFVFEYQVKSVDLAIWGYGASAVLRESDVKPIDYTTADA